MAQSIGGCQSRATRWPNFLVEIRPRLVLGLSRLSSVLPPNDSRLTLSCRHVKLFNFASGAKVRKISGGSFAHLRENAGNQRPGQGGRNFAHLDENAGN